MTAAPAGQSGESSGSTEVLYRTPRTLISRVPLSGSDESVIYKTPLGAGAASRLRHETRILERLGATPGVSHLARAPHVEGSLALEDVRGSSLAHVIQHETIDKAELLDIAIDLAQIVAAIHARGILHKDLNPGNILLSDAERRVVLIDFELATTYTQERPNFTHHKEIVGTLPYLAPEQTGRSGRVVDQRSELYTVGVTLYELATGRLPFEQDDALALIHDHLVRTPRTPASLDPSLPPALSAIIMRLLEKEPDRRYQGAAGLVYDLIRLKEAIARGSGEAFALAERDFPSILLAPSRLIGRETERATLRDAFENALYSPERAIFVTGSPGVGKTVLVETLRSVATERRGWFVKGKFDQVQQGAAGLRQALSALGRLLLAESEDELAIDRARIASALGTRAGYLTGLIPEFALILGLRADESPSEPLEADGAIRQAMLDLFRAVASPARPLVVFLDDLQWAGGNALGLIDAVVSDEALRGILIVGSYRDAEIEHDHPLARSFARWASLGTAPPQVHLLSLDPAHVSLLLGEMLRLAPEPAARLAETIGSRSAGNPLDTVELLNALRRDGILVSSADGWTWDDAKIRRYVSGKAIDLIAVRIARLGNDEREALSVIASLGGEVEIGALEIALEVNFVSVIDRLEAPLEDGLLLMERESSVRFSHDRVQQTVYERLTESERAALHLRIGRRLAAQDRFAFQAAEQYAFAVDRISEPAEALFVIGLFTRAAAVARLATSHADVERFLAAAITLLERHFEKRDRALFNQLQSERHAALYGLARYAEGDAVYRSIEENHPDLLALASAACVQVCSLANRGLQREAVAAGLELLARLGMPCPGSDALPSEVARDLDALQAWIDAGMPSSVPGLSPTDPAVLVVVRLAARVMPSAFFSDPLLSHWLGLQRLRLWRECGCPALFAPGLIGNATALIGTRGDYRRAYRLALFARGAVAQASEPDASRTRHIFALVASHWGQRLDNTLAYAREARAGLVAEGDAQFACYTYFASLPAQLECAPTLDSVADEAESAITFALRTNSVYVSSAYASYLRLAHVLAGKREAGDDSSTRFRELPTVGAGGPSTITAAVRRINLALEAAILDDREALVLHTAAAMPILPDGFYATAVAHVLRAYALALQIHGRTADRVPFDDELRQLDACLAWIARRAEDAPANFAHLVRFLQAERGWAVGDLAAAAANFDLALRETDGFERPWHRALISERAGAFFVKTGLERAAGRALIDEAHRRYRDWGASAKVRQLEDRYAFLRDVASERAPDLRVQTTFASPDSIDLRTILRVSQALSSETSLEKLRARIVEALGTMTGASIVHVVVFDDRTQRWFVSAGSAVEKPLPIEEATSHRAFPISAFRYVERTRQPLLVEDATKDDRFATDPYLAHLDRCSLLVVPIMSHGILRAVLLLENELSTGTFTTDRLDAVKLLAGQLAVSLENAAVYATLEDTVAERTQALQIANERLQALSITDALTGLPNRRRFVDYLDGEWKRSLRAQSPLGIAIVDVDHFKRYNDRYGHLAGDACLQLVSREMSRRTRQGIDLVARFGGEEFTIVLPGAGLSETEEVLERVRAGIAALAEPHETGEGGIVTVSAGATTMVPHDRDGVQRFLGAADALLYRAKTDGRNRVCAEAEAETETETETERATSDSEEN